MNELKGNILRAIEVMVQKYFDKYKDQDKMAVVTEIKADKYKVSMDGADYWLKDGVGISPKVGQAVWVHKPNGDIKMAYISALR